MEHKITSRKITKEEWDWVCDLHNRSANVIKLYAELLMWWNRKINLVSRGVPRETLIEHTRHSLCIALQKGFVDSNMVIDTGSGGGLPGIPLSIAFEDKDYLINDIVAKKIFAVNDMANKLRLQNRIKTNIGSIKDVDVEKNGLIITKHAFKINELMGHLNGKDWGEMIFLKGRSEVETELEGIETALKISIIDLETEFTGGFYDGKAVVSVKKKMSGG